MKKILILVERICVVQMSLLRLNSWCISVAVGQLLSECAVYGIWLQRLQLKPTSTDFY